ncbi:MAG: hypothetical protein HFH30_07255 [Eubacterium sp.]|nr:hypothetical protein [Eubacterium sp.]MCI8919800.1 hypothetical protein [Eubacterium sp.]
MAQENKYKLGEYEFRTEQEYREAAADLKRIKGIAEKYDVSNPEQAKKILATIQGHPEWFRSPYGKRFIEKLQSAAGMQKNNTPQTSTLKQQDKPKREKKAKKEKKPKIKKNADGSEKEKFQIFTVRNFVAGIIIIACVVVFTIFAPKLFSFQGNGEDGSVDVRKNMISSYAKNQAELKSKLYTYYFNVVGETEEEAEKDAQEGISHYVLDLSERTVSTMSDSEISEIYKQLVEGGDIQNNSFVEPAEISALKEKLLAAGLSGNTGNGVEGETAVAAAINSMMDYQQRMYYSLCHNYSLLGFKDKDCEKYANEDLEAMFGDVIYSFKMTDDEKQRYFESFQKKGLIKDNQIVRFTTDPTAYNLPDLTPMIEVALKGEKTESFECSMISYAPAVSVFYEIHSESGTGYICFRNHGANTQYIQLDEDTSVTAQGDFFIVKGSEAKLTEGKWFYNQQQVGIWLNGDTTSTISKVYDLTY